MIKALIFDFDGLILDTEDAEYRSWCEVYSAHGVELPLELWVKCIGTDHSAFDPQKHLGLLTAGPIAWSEVREQRRMRQLEMMAGLAPLPGVERYLERAAELGLKVAVASSSSRRWVGGHLDRLGLPARRSTRVFPPGEGPHPYHSTPRAHGPQPTRASHSR